MLSWIALACLIGAAAGCLYLAAAAVLTARFAARDPADPLPAPAPSVRLPS